MSDQPASANPPTQSGRTKGIPEADLSKLDPSSISFISSYTGIPESEIPAHVLAIRARGLRIEHYVCIASFAFLKPRLTDAPYASRILDKLKSGATLCDAGCCFGTDLRYLSFLHKVPATQLYGFDLEEEFVEGGYELFRDRDTWKGTLRIGNVLIDDPRLKELDGKMDIITCNSFLHVFDLPEMQIAANRLVGLTKGKGSMICGKQIGSPNARTQAIGIRDGNRYLHNPETMAKMWNAAGEATGTTWEVESGFFEREERKRECREERESIFSIYWVATRTS